MSGREDGLPRPVTADQQFLAAILDELRGVRALLAPPAPAEAPAAEATPELVQVREPVAPRGLPTPDPELNGEVVAAAAKVAAEAAKIRTRQASKATGAAGRKRTTRTRAK